MTDRVASSVEGRSRRAGRTPSPRRRRGATGRRSRRGGPAPVRLGWLGSLALGVASLVGFAAFTWPLVIHAHGSANLAHSSDAPWIMAIILPILLVAVIGEFNSGGIDAKGVALLGVLSACGAALRLPSGGAAGFEPVFFLLFPAGYVLGRHFGFLLGAITLFASALITGGVGPWLPFQMMAAAWMGFGAGCLPRWHGRPGRFPMAELVILAGYAAVASLAYGLLLDLWFWPFGAGTATTLSFRPGASIGSNLVRFLAFHFSTGLGFDLPRAALNAALVLIAGRPVIEALRRASRRAAFGVPVVISGPGVASGMGGAGDGGAGEGGVEAAGAGGLAGAWEGGAGENGPRV